MAHVKPSTVSSVKEVETLDLAEFSGAVGYIEGAIPQQAVHGCDMKDTNSPFLLRPKIVRVCTIVAMTVFLVGFTLAFVFAYFIGGPKSPPGNYSILNNYISDLGGHKFTPVPDLFDVVCIVTASLFGVVLTYANKVFAREIVEMPDITVTRRRILQAIRVLGFIGSIIGIAGLFCVGVFSEDRSTIGNVGHIHFAVSVITWVDLAIGSLGLGLLAVLGKIFIPKTLGVFMIMGPLTSVAIFGIAMLLKEISLPPLEWVMLVAVLWWTFPVGWIVLK